MSTEIPFLETFGKTHYGIYLWLNHLPLKYSYRTIPPEKCQKDYNIRPEKCQISPIIPPEKCQIC